MTENIFHSIFGLGKKGRGIKRIDDNEVPTQPSAPEVSNKITKETVILPEKLIQEPPPGQNYVVSLSGHRVSFEGNKPYEGIALALKSAEKGDLSRQHLFRLLTQVIGELELAKKNAGIDLTLLSDDLKVIISDFLLSPIAKTTTFEGVLTGQFKTINSETSPHNPYLQFQMNKPDTGVQGAYGVHYGARGKTAQEYDLVGLTICGQPTGITGILSRLVAAGNLFKDQPGSILHQIAKDATMTLLVK